MRYVWYATVKNVVERFEQVYVRGVGNDAVFDLRSLGWFLVLMEGSSIYMGEYQPPLKDGDRIKMTVEKFNG